MTKLKFLILLLFLILCILILGLGMLLFVQRPPKTNNTVPLTNNTPFALFVVLDDAGQRLDEITALENFLGTVTVAVLPRLNESKEIAEYLYFKNIPYIVHLPMEPLGDENPGEFALFTHSSDEELLSAIQYNFSDFDNYLGFNNHMGSKAVADKRVVDFLLSNLPQEMLVLDSRTSKGSILAERAHYYNMSVMSRDVFIDNFSNVLYIKEQIRKGIEIAQKKGGAILIGHAPKPQTIQALIDIYDEVIALEGQFLGLQDYTDYMESYEKVYQQ